MPFKKTPFLIALFLTLIPTSPPASVSAETGEKNGIRYQIECQLLPEEKTLLGSTTIRWSNPTKKPVKRLRFHLFYNAFKSEKTTLLQEYEFHKKSKNELEGTQFGEIKIKEMRIINGEELTQRITFISPDDQNPHDQTVMEVNLNEPVDPLQTITIKTDFQLLIPEIIDQTGRVDDYFFLSRWYPKIGVLEQDGSWNCHQYHRNAGFPGDFGRFQVAVTLPERFTIGATGNLEKKTKNQDGTYTYVFSEKDIHRFVWVAYPHFQETIEKIRLKGKSQDTKIVMLLPPDHQKEKKRYLRALKFSLSQYAELIFPYPYKKIILMVPPHGTIGSASQSYPGLISVAASTLWPRCFLQAERRIIREFGHQYWNGILGPDTGREAWLDEGLNAYFETELMEKYIKNPGSPNPFRWLEILNRHHHRWKYLGQVKVEKIQQYAWKFMNTGTFKSTVRSKSALLLQTLGNHLGRKRLLDFFRFFARRFAYKHPTTRDFVDNFNQFMGQDFTGLFQQFLSESSTLDHSVYILKSVKINSSPDRYRNEIVFIRKRGYFPVDLLIKLRNGKEIKIQWKERENWKKIVLENDCPVEYAAVDPEFKIPLDMNVFNNSKRCKAPVGTITKIALKIGFWFQNLLGFLVL